jgi:hypothetical protein
MIAVGPVSLKRSIGALTAALLAACGLLAPLAAQAAPIGGADPAEAVTTGLPELAGKPKPKPDTCAMAHAVGVGKLAGRVVTINSSNWYKVTVPPLAAVTVRADFLNRNGVIDMEGFETCAGPVVASASTQNGGEEIQLLNPTNAPATRFVAVYLASGTRAVYNLTVSPVGGTGPDAASLVGFWEWKAVPPDRGLVAFPVVAAGESASITANSIGVEIVEDNLRSGCGDSSGMGGGGNFFQIDPAGNPVPFAFPSADVVVIPGIDAFTATWPHCSGTAGGPGSCKSSNGLYTHPQEWTLQGRFESADSASGSLILQTFADERFFRNDGAVFCVCPCADRVFSRPWNATKKP